jgi:hypothetical protein
MLNETSETEEEEPAEDFVGENFLISFCGFEIGLVAHVVDEESWRKNEKRFRSLI